nr:MAG TPA: hypothetical protein [Caudoviricetes sp.]
MKETMEMIMLLFIEFINCRNALLVSHIMLWTNF